ncbi:unnamed protein product [Anisakis simplex]|uniref:Chromo domain-containing protein n=1 Tax=Anisakis simplex TaxID=6269 RepID=A0A0M3K8J7_ANISI|nr:unnamed protein product [Anisakis simplex]
MPGRDHLPSTSDGDLYEVESIMGYRYNKTLTRSEFLIKWKGYPIDEASWQPMADLISCQSSVAEFLRDSLRPACKDKSLPVPYWDDELDELPSTWNGTEEEMKKLVFPKSWKSGIAKGWKPKRIIGSHLTTKPHTYCVEYEGRRLKEHIDGEYLYERYRELVEEYHSKFDDLPIPFEKRASSRGTSHHRKRGNDGHRHRKK